MYSLAPEYSETRWLEKCSTLIGSGTAAWAFIFRQRGQVRHSFPDLSACRTYSRSNLPSFRSLLIFQLLADGDNNLYLDNSRI